MNKFYLSIVATLVGSAAVFGGTPPIPDYTLESMVTYALEQNFDIQKAQEQIREQEGYITEITAQVLPNASVSASYTVDDEGMITGGVTPGTGADKFWNIGVTVNQLVYAGGAVRSSLKAQHFMEESITYSLQTTIEQVVYLVSLNFYGALLAREQIEVEQQNVAYLEEQLTTTEDRFQANTVSKFDVLRAKVELANAKPALIKAKNNYRIAIDELYSSIGHQNTDVLDYDGSEIEGALEFDTFDYSLNASISAAVANRPELLQLESIIAAREAGIDVAKSGYYPKVSVYAGYGLEKNPLHEEFDESNTGWNVGIQSSWDIWDGRATRGKLIQARSQLRQSQLDRQQLQLSIEVDVRRAVSALQEAEELAAAASLVVEQGEEALRLAEVRYEAGAATQLELLDARVSLTEAKTNQLSANYSFLTALAQYRKAVGWYLDH